MNNAFHENCCNLCGLSFAAHGNDPDAACPLTATVPEVAPADDSDGSVESIVDEAKRHSVTVIATRPTIQGYYEVDLLGPEAGVRAFLDTVGWGAQFTTWTRINNHLICPENAE